MTAARRVASNFGWSVLTEAVGKGIFFIANIYLARRLGVENFGVFSLAQTITCYFWLAVDLGTSMYGVREIAKNKDQADAIINPLLTIRVVSGWTVFLFYSTILSLIPLSPGSRLIYAATGLYFVTYSLYTDWVLKGLERFKFIAFGSMISSVCFLGATLALVNKNEDVVAAALAWSLSYLFGALSLLYILRKKMGIALRAAFDLRIWLYHLKESIYFTISGALLMFYQYIPIVLLSIFFTTYEVGLFAAPYRVITTVSGAGFLIPLAFYPVLSDLYAKDKQKFAETHKRFQIIMLLLGVPIAVIGTVWGRQIVGILFGEQYMQGAQTLKILSWLIPLYFLRSTYGSVLMATGYQRLHNLTTLTGVACVLSVGVITVKKWGITGGAFALIVAELSIIGAMMVVAHYTFMKQCREDKQRNG